MRTDGPVVIALDGTPHSAHTLEWGVAEAVRRDAPVLLTRVVDDAWLGTVWSWYPVVDPGGLEADVEEYLRAQRAAVQERHPGLAVEARTTHGQVVPSLRDLSEDAQLLVVGTRTPQRRARTGSTGAHVTAHARCPVAVVRTDPLAPTRPDDAVVVGVDGSPSSLTAADAAAAEARMRGCRLVVVHARPTVPDPSGTRSLPPLGMDDMDDLTHKEAQVVANTLRAENPGLTVDLVLVDDDPADALTRLAGSAALLVVGSRGLGRFRGMLLGSVSGAVVREATCPVLVVHDGT